MAYLSLYRKYRPQTFAQVMGQDHVVQTLQNALRFGHVANGYLFCGTRGVAKTTLARILAKCLNCIGIDGTLAKPQAEPCNQCDFCRSIQAGQCVDVVEMDAASNRSVNDMAKLRENVQFGPMETRYKVYIVDEAHQLSSDAKDAFLKTLEEPPANVVFILATTEAHAIPITIASRCQQFDFRRGSIQQIAEQCGRVLNAEGVEMPTDALAIVARAAEGSYRDALSLLDQVLAYKRENITAADVAGALGTVEGEMIDRALNAVLESDHAALFALADDVYLHGKDVRQFLKAAGSRLRDLLYLRSGANLTGMLESGADSVSAGAMAKRFSPATLVRGLEIITEADRQTRFSDQHRLLLEMTLMKLAMIGQTPSVAPASAATESTASTPPPRPARPIPPRPPAVKAIPPAEPAYIAPPPQASGVSSNVISTIDAIAERHEPQAEIQPQVAVDAVLTHLKASWQEVINHVQVRAPGGAPVIQDATPIEIEGSVIVLQFSKQGNMAKLEKPRSREVFEQVINKILRVPENTYKIRCVRASSGPPAAIKAEPVRPEVTRQDEPTPVLDEVISVFGGLIIEPDEGEE